MPLSEDEQRILSQIEQQFYESDPAFATSVSQTTLYRHSLRSIKWAAVGLVGGLAFLVIATLWIHFVVAFLGFLAMLACAFVIERHARAMGRAGFQEVTRAVPASKLKNPFNGGPRRRPDTDRG
jgi:hypothetical protein